ncbi:formimidoylglutamate deiminase [Swaminathania salitolerans]|uniref:Formimidoylglutamate deiminase n=1 Tax=Swaminathania salitolerans TaxID=182838 RepID=A0A511BQT1_9PROT|nr:formimidoylglutamate deiminase [Swaminathania salitolerans]GBQ12002.1 N-formimino-L-glutamate deiminase [Swaminathania salitolerans LMG 21291]GEL02697.1 formimidoylglutamate deiminase [Swaminathania salitolerans]
MSPQDRTRFLFARQALLPGGWRHNVRLSIADGQFVRIEANSAPEPGDTRCAIALPPLSSLHSHAFQRAMAGLAESRRDPADSFWTWRRQMYALAARITPDDMRAIAAQLYLELLKSGFTQVGEFHYLHRAPDGSAYDTPAAMALALVDAAQETGIGITILPTLYRHAGFGRALAPEQKRFASTPDFIAGILETIAARHDADPRIRHGLGLHSLRAVDRESLSHMLSMVGADIPVHIHVAEQKREVTECLDYLGRRPVAWLLDEAPVDSRWCLVHATHLDEDETRRLAASGATAGLCPVTEANLGDGFFPLNAYVSQGGRFGIGTDSNCLPSAAEELRLLEYGQRLTARKRCCALPSDMLGSVGRYLYDSALEGGTRACGHAGGRIAPGTRADLCILDEAAMALPDLEQDAILDGMIFACPVVPVRDVMVAGEWVVRDGYHAGQDRIAAAFRETVRRLRS